jgi:glc operon protein GlcG
MTDTNNNTDYVRYRPTLTYNAAAGMLEAIVEASIRRNVAVVAAIVDEHGELLSFARMDGAPLASVENAIGKARTAALTGANTGPLQDKLVGGRYDVLAARALTPMRGGVVISSDGMTIGGIGVSGLSGNEDELIARIGLGALGVDEVSQLASRIKSLGRPQS